MDPWARATCRLSSRHVSERMHAPFCVAFFSSCVAASVILSFFNLCCCVRDTQSAVCCSGLLSGMLLNFVVEIVELTAALPKETIFPLPLTHSGGAGNALLLPCHDRLAAYSCGGRVGMCTCGGASSLWLSPADRLPPPHCCQTANITKQTRFEHAPTGVSHSSTSSYYRRIDVSVGVMILETAMFIFLTLEVVGVRREFTPFFNIKKIPFAKFSLQGEGHL